MRLDDVSRSDRSSLVAFPFSFAKHFTFLLSTRTYTHTHTHGCLSYATTCADAPAALLVYVPSLVRGCVASKCPLRTCNQASAAAAVARARPEGKW